MDYENDALDIDNIIITDDDESQFTLLPEGDYPFTVSHMERGHHDATDKIGDCPTVIVFFNVQAPDGGTSQLQNTYLIHKKMLWKLFELFSAVGLKKKGEELRVDWNALPGLRGMCRVVQVPGTKDPSKTFNRIDRLLPPGAASGQKGGGSAWAF